MIQKGWDCDHVAVQISFILKLFLQQYVLNLTNFLANQFLSMFQKFGVTEGSV